MNDSSTIEALVQLIDDPDHFVYEKVRDELIVRGTNVIPYLESSWMEDHYGLLFHQRADQLIKEIHFSETKKELVEWINSDKKSLLEGSLIIARYQFFHLEEEKVIQTIESIKNDVWLEINPKQTALEKINIFNKIFFEKYKFSGNQDDYLSPMNSFINSVIDSRKGNPLSLSILYSIIGQELGLPIFGVNLPNHFIVTYLDHDKIRLLAGLSNEYGNLFYIDPYASGAVFDSSTIDTFLEKEEIDKKTEFYEPCSNSTIINRMINNLINGYLQKNNESKVKELRELKLLFNDKI